MTLVMLGAVAVEADGTASADREEFGGPCVLDHCHCVEMSCATASAAASPVAFRFAIDVHEIYKRLTATIISHGPKNY